MHPFFDKSQALFGEQAEWFGSHAAKSVETLVSDGETLTRAMREGVEAALKNQAELMNVGFAGLKKATEAQVALWRGMFSTADAAG